MYLEFSDGSAFVADKETDTFFLGFNNNLILRESCYRCKYCGTNRIADFTLADFWGVSEKRATAEQKKNGISLLLVNSGKGQSLMKALSERMEIASIEPSEAIPYNKALVKPNTRPEKRDKVFSRIAGGKDYNSIILGTLRGKMIKLRIKRVLGDRAVRFLKKVRGSKNGGK